MRKLSEPQKRVLSTMLEFDTTVESRRTAWYVRRDLPLPDPGIRTIVSLTRKGLLTRQPSDWDGLSLYRLTAKGREVAQQLEEPDAQD